MQLCNMAEIDKEEVEFPASATLWQGGIYIRWQHLIFVLCTIVQLYKEDWGNLAYVGLFGHSSPQYQVDNLYIYAYMYTCRQPCMGIYVCMWGINTHMTHMYLCIYVCVNVCVHICMQFMYVYTYMLYQYIHLSII